MLQVSASTVIVIASQPNLNMIDETEVFYALWMRATIDCCRADESVTYENIFKYFEPYSVCIQFRYVNERKLRSFNNEKILRCYKWVMDTVQPAPVIFKERAFRYPEKLTRNFFDRYLATDIKSFIQFFDKSHFVHFSVKESMFIIQMKLTYAFNGKRSLQPLKQLLLKVGDQILVQEKYPSLSYQESIAKTCGGAVPAHDLLYNLKDAVKLHSGKQYILVIEPFHPQYLWPVVNVRGQSHLLEFHSDYMTCLTGVTFVKTS